MSAQREEKGMSRVIYKKNSITLHEKTITMPDGGSNDFPFITHRTK